MRAAPPPASPSPLNASDPRPANAPRRSSALPWFLALAVFAMAAWSGWHAWQARQAERSAAVAGQQQRLEALEAQLAALRRDQRAQAQRLQQADATNRVLRDELLGLAQRAALLEDSLDKLADPQRSAAQAMGLDEVEWLLGLGQQRLQLAGDLAGARHAYALAAQRLDGIGDLALLDLRQVLAQERAALDALGADPKATAALRIEAFAAQLPALSPVRGTTPDAEAAPWWRRAFKRIVDVRPSSPALALDATDRAAGFAALQLELGLARASAERRDVEGYRAALARADAWLQRLWPESERLSRQRQQLRALRALPLALDLLPTLGSTLAQLRRLHDAP